MVSNLRADQCHTMTRYERPACLELSYASDKSCKHYEPMIACPDCRGTGLADIDYGKLYWNDAYECDACNGTGLVCPTCKAPAAECQECGRVVKPDGGDPYCFVCGLKPEHNGDVHYARP